MGKNNYVERKARTVLVQTKSCETYNQAELSLLLMYYQVKGLSGMKKDAMVSKWRGILEIGQDAPPFEGCSEDDERKLNTLTSQPILMADTALGQHQEVLK